MLDLMSPEIVCWVHDSCGHSPALNDRFCDGERLHMTTDISTDERSGQQGHPFKLAGFLVEGVRGGATHSFPAKGDHNVRQFEGGFSCNS